MMVRKIMLLTIATATFALGACNTVDGAGKDLKSAGDAVEKAAD
ncbi:MAG: entericidin A/B family lipoprotein [Sphingomonadaceae bacterium]